MKMKKIALLGLGAFIALTATAQTSLVKDVERQMKADITKYPAQLGQLTPAFSDPETKDTPYPYFVAGKGGYDFYDHLDGYKKIGQKVDDKAAGKAFIDGYGYLIEALRRDSVPDEKGKVKPKYSKDIIKLIANHINDYDQCARYLWEVQDWDGAYDAWAIYLSAPYDPVLSVNAPKAQPDSVTSELYYNQALAAWQAEHFDKALASFDKARSLGYDKKQLYDYAIGVAYQAGDHDKMAYYAELAYPKYGNDDSRYIGYIINAKIKKGETEQAKSLLEEYIAADPQNARLYYVLGYLYDTQNDTQKALDNYRKSVELDPEDADANFQLGRTISNIAYETDDKASQLPTNEYNVIRQEQVNPLFREAAVYLEKSFQLAPDEHRDALPHLRSIYYNVGDSENLSRIEQEQKY